MTSYKLNKKKSHPYCIVEYLVLNEDDRVLMVLAKTLSVNTRKDITGVASSRPQPPCGPEINGPQQHLECLEYLHEHKRFLFTFLMLSKECMTIMQHLKVVLPYGLQIINCNYSRKFKQLFYMSIYCPYQNKTSLRKNIFRRFCCKLTNQLLRISLDCRSQLNIF